MRSHGLSDLPGVFGSKEEFFGVAGASVLQYSASFRFFRAFPGLAMRKDPRMPIGNLANVLQDGSTIFNFSN